MSKHTPGPWIEFADGQTTVAILPAMRPDSVCDFAPSRFPSRADARLIAAAPDLLAALEAVMAEWREGYGLNCVEQCRAAIAKARAATNNAKAP